MSFYLLVVSGILQFVILVPLSADDWITGAARSLEMIAAAVVIYYLGRKFPLRAPATLTREDLATPISGWWTFSACTLAIILGAGLCFGSVYAARAVNAKWAVRQGDAVFLLTPSGAWWYLYGGFLGLLMAWPAASYLLRLMMPEREWAIWLAQQNQRGGFDCNRAMRWLACLVMLPYTAFFLPSLGCHTRFGATEFGIQRYSDRKETRYSYADVTRLAVAKGYLDRDKKFHADPEVVIDLRQGRRWTTRNGLRDPMPVDEDLLRFLAAHTKLKPVSVVTEDQLK